MVWYVKMCGVVCEDVWCVKMCGVVHGMCGVVCEDVWCVKMCAFYQLIVPSGNGSTCCQKRCSILTMVCLSMQLGERNTDTLKYSLVIIVCVDIIL